MDSIKNLDEEYKGNWKAIDDSKKYLIIEV